MRSPLPRGFTPTLWRGEERFVQAYLSRYPGYYLTADVGYTDQDGYLYVMSRIDDMINDAGHRLSTGPGHMRRRQLDANAGFCIVREPHKQSARKTWPGPTAVLAAAGTASARISRPSAFRCRPEAGKRRPTRPSRA